MHQFLNKKDLSKGEKQQQQQHPKQQQNKRVLYKSIVCQLSIILICLQIDTW